MDLYLEKTSSKSQEASLVCPRYAHIILLADLAIKKSLFTDADFRGRLPMKVLLDTIKELAVTKLEIELYGSHCYSRQLKCSPFRTLYISRLAPGYKDPLYNYTEFINSLPSPEASIMKLAVNPGAADFEPVETLEDRIKIRDMNYEGCKELMETPNLGLVRALVIHPAREKHYNAATSLMFFHSEAAEVVLRL
ncbi:hypothetical protein TruAng_001109 [Truncatella angustata]|nr:hypothetical protein TruAng_001109 [Truncatella angustata]